MGSYEVFAGASLLTNGVYDVSLASIDGQPITGPTGLTFVAAPLPDPNDQIDTVVLPCGLGIEAARLNRELIEWIKIISGNARLL